MLVAALALSLAGLGTEALEERGGLVDTTEAGVKLLLDHAQNLSVASEDGDVNESCLVFLLYSTSCPFSKRLYSDVEELSLQYDKSIAFVAMEKTHSSLNLLMQFGFHAVPQVVVYSPSGRDKLKGSDKQTTLRNYLQGLVANPNVSCNIASFKDVLPLVERESKPTTWTDGSQEMTRITWIVVACLGVFYLSVFLHEKFTGRKLGEKRKVHTE